MTSVFKSLAAAAVFAAGLAATGPALADDGAQEFAFRVDRASLTSESAIRVAYQRLSAEAQRYCEALPLADDREAAICRADVVSHVVEAVRHDGLASLHAERTQHARYVADTQY